jgi:hypothetical protein
MKASILFLVCALASGPSIFAAATALAWDADQGLLIVADGERNVVEAHDGTTGILRWTVPADGLEVPRIATGAGSGRAVVLDPASDRVLVVDTADGRSWQHQVEGTPIEAVASRDGVYVLARDSGRLVRIVDETMTSVAGSGGDATFLRFSSGDFYVYRRTAGALDRYGPDLSPAGMLAVPPFASAMQFDGDRAWLAYPQRGTILSVMLPGMTLEGEVRVGGAPVDLAIAARADALTATRLLIADPSLRVVWTTEGLQSMGRAIARGFLRGLLGLGLYRDRALEVPTPVDRVFVAGNTRFGLDSVSGTLYRLERRSAVPVARDVCTSCLVSDGESLFVWTGSQFSVLSSQFSVLSR